MSNTTLRDQAVSELQLTTVGWLKSNGNPRYPSGTAPMTTHWGKAMALLAQITNAVGGSTYGSGTYGGN
jgi:hypothetical protein